MYSHGLERIYAFENINPSSVKTVASKGSIAAKTPSEPVLSAPIQLMLPMGPLHQQALPSFRLQEPISSLGLSAFALKALETKNIRTCVDVCHFLDNGSQKGLGQSHIEEIEAKTLAFMGKNPFLLSQTVDWESLVRISSHHLEAKERYCLLARYGLEELARVSSIEQQEVARLSHEQIATLIDQALGDIISRQSSFIHNALCQIADAYVKPWLYSRHGFAPASEIYERLFMISHTPKLFWQTLDFLRLFGEPIKLEIILDSAVQDESRIMQDGLFAVNVACLYDFNAVVECAKSYFYTPHSSYPLAALVGYTTKALAMQWLGFQQGFVEKAITHSKNFMTHGNHFITLALGGL